MDRLRRAGWGVHIHAHGVPCHAGRSGEEGRRRGGQQIPNCSLAPGHANVSGGPAERPLETKVLSAERSLPEEGNDTHRPVGKGEQVDEGTAHLLLEVGGSQLP